MSEGIANIALMVGQPPFVIFVMIAGLLSSHRKQFINLISLLMFSFLWVAMWKTVIAKPLPAFLNKPHGYAFPSGHMHSTALIWGYLAYYLRHLKWLWLVALAIIVIEGWALIYMGFHDCEDVAAGALAGWLLVWLCVYLWRRYDWQHRHASIALLGAVLSSFCFLWLHQNQFQYVVLMAVWLWYAALRLKEFYDARKHS